MGSLLKAQGRLPEAEAYYREALKGLRRVLGDDHPATLLSINNMGLLRRDQGRQFEAEELFAEALRRARRALVGDPVLGEYLRRHAQALVAMERFEQAETELVEAQEILAAALGPGHARTNLAITALAELYDAWHAAEPNQGHDTKAAEWRAKLVSGERTGTDADE